MVKNKHDCPNSGCFINGRPMGKKHNCCQVSPPNQVSWEERFDEEFDCKCGDMGIPHIRFDMSGSETIKAFIRSLLKEERVKAYKQGFNKATEYAKYAIATNNMFENSVKAVRKQVKFEASRRAKSKLSKGKV